MPHSMTAFARQEQQTAEGLFCWELRSVNHRYLDINLRLPEDFRYLEGELRTQSQQQLKRGKFDGVLYYQPSNQAVDFHLNVPLVKKLTEAVNSVHTLLGHTTTINAVDILRWPEVLEFKSMNLATLENTVKELFQQTLQTLIQQRRREGQQLAELLMQRCVAIRQEIVQVRQELPTILQNLRERLLTRLAELQELNSERIEQEMVIVAQKMDVAEELDRIEAHIDEIHHILQTEETIGRRLDFLVQELHREANTLSAKANHVNTTRRAVELKVLIEQMREQTQNIE